MYKSKSEWIAHIIRYFFCFLFYYLGVVKLSLKIKKVSKKYTVKILGYHNISNTFPKYLNLSLATHIFESQIKYLQKNYKIISLNEAIKIIKKKKKLTKDCFVITFDDNYKEYYTEVIPLKKKYNFKMTLFITVDPLLYYVPLFVDALIYDIDKTKNKSFHFLNLLFVLISTITALFACLRWDYITDVLFIKIINLQ